MNKFGLIFCAYGIPEYVENSISPWVKLKDKLNITITTCHGLFKESFENGVIDNDFETLNKLSLLQAQAKIDYLYVQNHYGMDSAWDVKKYETEAKIRDYCLQYLLKNNVDYVILWDLDEFTTEQEIENLINYIQKTENKFYYSFNIEYKNLVFTENQYIEGFTPPRVFKVDTGPYKIKEIYWDNDVSYVGKAAGDVQSYKNFAAKTISKGVIYPLHKSWLSNERSLIKQNYQKKHFGHCGYKWNYDKNELEFNLDFYKKHNVPLPVVKNIEKS